MTRREEIEKEAEEYARDVFVVDRIGNFGINMNEYDAFIDGAEWADKTMLDKACKWLNENKDNSFIKCEDPCLVGYLTDEFIEEFKKPMEDKE